MTKPTAPLPRPTVALYAAPPVFTTPVTEVISQESINGSACHPGHYQRILLNTRTGELAFHESTEHLEMWDPRWTCINDVPRETWKRWHPGTLFLPGGGPHQWFQPVPELLSWSIDSGVEELPFLDVAAASSLLEELLPYAQDLLGSLFDAGGDLDWSARSARAGRNIVRLCSRYRKAALPEVDADLVDFGDIVQRFPQVYSPQRLRLPLDRLGEECEYTTRYLGCNEKWHPEIKKVYGRLSADGTYVYLDVTGVRAWYRTVLLQGDPRPLRDFADWDIEHKRLAAATITSASTDAELDTWAEREESSAAESGLRLIGARDAIAGHRTALREQEWDRLAVVGAEIAGLQELMAERLQLTKRAIDWGRTDTEIGVRARMTRQAVNKIRTAVGDGAVPDVPET